MPNTSIYHSDQILLALYVLIILDFENNMNYYKKLISTFFHYSGPSSRIQ